MMRPSGFQNDVVQAIMLVESEDGQSALLGRAKSIRSKGILTCLSGFIEQGESIEEAVRREIMEEAGLPVTSVVILGSQPWPIGETLIVCPPHDADNVDALLPPTPSGSELKGRQRLASIPGSLVRHSCSKLHWDHTPP